MTVQPCGMNLKSLIPGIGMSEEFIKEQLFKPFTQEKNDARTLYRGTGLGMSIVKALLDKMGGSIEVESQLGEGSTFTFLPSV